MWKDSIKNIVVIFQTTILRFVGFYVRHSAQVYSAFYFRQMAHKPGLTSLTEWATGAESLMS